MWRGSVYRNKAECKVYIMKINKYNVIFKMLIAILGVLLFAEMSFAQPVSDIEKIKHFYVRYMEAIEEGDVEMTETLVQQFLTKEMQAKMGRLVCATGANPLLRAQDVSAYGRQSLRCKHLEDDWYMVSYQWGEMDSVGIHIPLKIVKDAKGQPRIGYVTPEYAGDGYGNKIFDVSAVDVKDNKDAHTFVETFFKAYVYPYVIMTPSLEQDLARLRQTYFTADMQKKYVTMLQMFLEDANPIDPLIGCADFDAFWYGSLKVESIGSNLFTVWYNTGGGIVRVKLAVMPKNGEYRICDLNLD